ncbi:MAG: glycine zipper domain-containing protein [Rhodospirillaceae bacterium]
METGGMQGSTSGTQYAGEAASTVNRATERVHETVDRVADAATSSLQQLGINSEEWLAMKDRAVETTRGYVRENPLMALGIALAVGILLARITR